MRNVFECVNISERFWFKEVDLFNPKFDITFLFHFHCGDFFWNEMHKKMNNSIEWNKITGISTSRNTTEMKTLTLDYVTEKALCDRFKLPKQPAATKTIFNLTKLIPNDGTNKTNTTFHSYRNRSIHLLWCSLSGLSVHNRNHWA